MKLCTEEDVVQALTCQYGFPYPPLANYEIAPEVVACVPMDICKQFCLVPIDKIGRSFDPGDGQTFKYAGLGRSGKSDLLLRTGIC